MQINKREREIMSSHWCKQTGWHSISPTYWSWISLKPLFNRARMGDESGASDLSTVYILHIVAIGSGSVSARTIASCTSHGCLPPPLITTSDDGCCYSTAHRLCRDGKTRLPALYNMRLPPTCNLIYPAVWSETSKGETSCAIIRCQISETGSTSTLLFSRSCDYHTRRGCLCYPLSCGARR